MRVGTHVYYMCWSHSRWYIVTSTPVRHKTVMAGIQRVGVHALMPWCASVDDCLLRYYTLYTKDTVGSKAERLRRAKLWDERGRKDDFVTWTDVPMKQKHTQKANELAAKAKAAAEAAAAETTMAEERRRLQEATTKMNKAATELAQAAKEAGAGNKENNKRGRKRNRYVITHTNAAHRCT
jgi:hypothetical protein